MLIDVGLPLMSLDGKVRLKDNSEVPMTLGTCLIAALLASDHQGVSDTEKKRRYDLAKCLHGGDELQDGKINLPLDDVAYVRKLAGVLFSPLVMGQIYEMLDPATDARAPLCVDRSGADVSGKTVKVEEVPDK